MLVSVVIPACEAHATIAVAVASLRAQTHAGWEAIIVSDDGADYLGHLAAQGIRDPRLRGASTGGLRTGCHRARNAGLKLARGDFTTQLDADDEWMPERLADLLPMAAQHGAAADNLLVRDAATGATLYRALGEIAAPVFLDAAAIVALTTPLVPLIRRDHVLARADGVELAEDVIANLQLVARIGRLPALARSSYVYNIRNSSICHLPGAATGFGRAYAAYMARLGSGDGFGLPPDIRRAAHAAFAGRSARNNAFAAAAAAGFSGSFQHFVAARRSGL